MSRHRCFQVAGCWAVLGTVLLGGATGIAASVDWTGTTSNQWTESTNWSGGTPAGNIVYIRGGSNQPVELSSLDTVESIQLGSGAGTSGSLNILPGAKLTTTGPSSRLGSGGMGLITQTGGEVIFGQHLSIADYGPGSGTYNLQAGSVSVNGGYLTIGMRDAGYFNISGASTLTVMPVFYVGSSHVDNGGSGTVTQDGGTVSTNGGLTLANRAGVSGVYQLNNGTLNVTGNIVNGAGSGTMNIDGGTLNLLTSSAAVGFDTLRLGNAAGTTGMLTLAGTQTFTVTDLILGNQGTGTLTQNGGTANVTTMTLGSQSGSAGAYTLNGGSLTLVNSLAKTAGTGTLNIDGGTLNLSGNSIALDNLRVGYATGNTGVLTLAAGKTATIATMLTVGQQGSSSGTLTISPDATLNATAFILGDGGTGLVNQSGGMANVASYLYLANSGSSSGTYNLSGGTLNFTGGSWGLTVGMRGTANFNVSGSGNLVVNNVPLYVGSSAPGTAGTGTVTQNGGTVTAHVGIILANQSGSSGTYTLNGGTLTVNGDITDGAGASKLTIDGGTLVLGGSAITVDKLWIGDQAGRSGSLTLSGAQTVTVTELEVGERGGSTGLLNVGGDASLVVSGWSRIGNYGSATVEQTGGEVRFNGFALADGPNSTGTYRISDGKLTVGSLTIAMRGTGDLEVSAEATVETNALYVGSRTNDNYSAVGTLTQTGGLVDAKGTGIILAQNTGGTGIYNLQGGTLQATIIAKGVGTGQFNFTGGTLHAGTVNFSLVQEGGILAPGTSVGATTINGDYTLNAGTLQIELAGLGASDLLSVNGGVNLTGGSLELLLGYEPSVGDSFTLLMNDESDSINGTFAGLSEGAWVLGSFGGAVYPFRITYRGGTGNDIALIGVPEPATLPLGLLGLLACLAYRPVRRSRRS